MGVRLRRYNNGIVSDNNNSSGGVQYHNELWNRDLDNQHPINAITGLQEALDEINANLDNVVNNFEDSKTIDFDVNDDKVIAKVKIFDSEDNMIQEKTTGLYVDKYLDIEVEDTNAVHLTIEGKGETLKTMYEGGNVFSHYGGTNNIYYSDEANAWYFDENLQSFVQPKNTTSFTGFVSSVKYRTYTHKATMRSSDSDNDGNGLIIAYVKDANGIPHTLSCIINKGGESHAGNFYYAIVYNRNLDGEKIIKTGQMSSGHSTSGWNNDYITMEVSKSGSAIECSISNWNSLDININTVMNIDLYDYDWGHYFIGKVQYGYCNQSQANSYFTDIYFKGKGALKADLNISNKDENAIQVLEDGLYVHDNKETINTTEDTNSIDFDHDRNNKILKANVKLSAFPNAASILKTGLYVPKFDVKQSNSISLDKYDFVPEIIYKDVIKFSHYSRNAMYNETDANLWYWDSQKNAMVLPSKCSQFCGAVTNDTHDIYTHQVTITSSQNSSESKNGVVIAFIYDENNNPHTITFIGSDIWYNYNLGGIRLASFSNLSRSSNWADIPKGITIKIIKNKNNIQIFTTQFNSSVFEYSKTIDLNSYSWGYLFSEQVRCGYCSEKGSQVYFSNISFISNNIAETNKLLANVNISNEQYNNVIEKNDGIYIPGNFVKLTAREW